MAKKLKPGDPAPGGQMLTKEGQPTELDHLWPYGPTFLTFLRHFG